MFTLNTEEIIYKKNDEIEFIQFKRLLKYKIKHAYTLKGKNIDFSIKSEKSDYSYKKICDALEIDVNTLVKGMQTHSSNVRCINEIESLQLIEDTDGFITNKSNIAITSKNADCTLFLLYDPVKKVVANVHSGWRGTFQKIIEKTVVKMITMYQCDPKDIICCICPSIRKCHFEVEEDVKQLCENIFRFTNRLEDFIEIGEIKDSKQKYMIDTIEINKYLLRELGIKEKNIIDSNICSVCNKDKISSRRAEKENYTLAIAVISM